jgi:hypothetical protein
MQDSRYADAIVKRWQAGVPVRILIDPRANPTYDGNATLIATFQLAGIPLRKRTASGILHWKLMLFALRERDHAVARVSDVCNRSEPQLSAGAGLRQARGNGVQQGTAEDRRHHVPADGSPARGRDDRRARPRRADPHDRREQPVPRSRLPVGRVERQKLVLLYGQTLAIFGSSNWTTASATSQAEHNYFSTKSAMFLWFVNQFERMWNNTNASAAAETAPFVPLPPDAPKNKLPASASLITTSTATLTWYGGPWAHNYDIYFGTSSNPPLVAANVNLGPSPDVKTNQQWTTPPLAASTTYYWKIVSKTMANLAVTGPVWNFTTDATVGGSAPPNPLPVGWSQQDVGAVGVAGSGSYSNGAFTIAGSGADVWGTADEFHFAYHSLAGDGQLVARVATVQNVNAWTKAGVMIRSTTAANSAYGFMLVSAAKGSAFQYRTTAGGTAANTAGPLVAVPYYVKIVRAGSTVTGFVSSDGATWTTVGSAAIALGAVDIGLAVCSHDDTRTATATFDNVQ